MHLPPRASSSSSMYFGFRSIASPYDTFTNVVQQQAFQCDTQNTPELLKGAIKVRYMHHHYSNEIGLTYHSMQPPEPCYWRPAGSAQILKFYGYGAQIIAWSDVYRSLQRAATDAETHVSDEPMGWWERQYGSVDVRLLLHPGPSMTWGMWKETITGIGHFVTHYQFLDMDFDIVQTGTMVGTGILTVL